MIGFLRSRYRRFLRKEEFLNKFFYSEFDLAVLEERRTHHDQYKQERGVSSMPGLKDPKEEPVEEMALDLENRRYSFYLRPHVGEE